MVLSDRTNRIFQRVRLIKDIHVCSLQPIGKHGQQVYEQILHLKHPKLPATGFVCCRAHCFRHMPTKPRCKEKTQTWTVYFGRKKAILACLTRGQVKHGETCELVAAVTPIRDGWLLVSLPSLSPDTFIHLFPTIHLLPP